MSAIRTIVVMMTLVAAWTGVLLWLDSISCHRKWDQSGLRVEYALMAGCMLQRADGTWIPADSYREIP